MRTPRPGFSVLKFLIILPTLLLFLSGCGLFGQRDNPLGRAAAKTSRQYLGVPYKLGGQSPSGFDCSGLTAYVYKRHGVSLPRTADQQAQKGQYVKKRNLLPGDLVFFRTSRFFGPVSHVGIYLGHDQFINAPGSGKKVAIASLSTPYYQKYYHSARRIRE
ncbi:MAG: C40 family peptidase [Candidatus Adiutrix sp.]|jgi:cell wall-associated NlpC family hydrolase|nr:C40 family peptidase [Candidatus Adiutrix sp.]